jgi:uncharacterized integral membrane protein
MPSIKLVAALILAAILVVFGAQNTQSVTFHFLVFDAGPVPVVLVVFLAAILGALLAWIVSAPGRFRGMRHRRDLEHQIAAVHEPPAAPEADVEEPRPEPPTE